MSTLSAVVSASAARCLLVNERGDFTALLTRLGPDRDLAKLDSPLADGWVGWEVMTAPRRLSAVGPATASELLA